jgi:prepilin-type N-terminal cleavage/methylation domain-containing protein/prepilin-type processing-associated H-X9-DG protein
MTLNKGAFAMRAYRPSRTEVIVTEDAFAKADRQERLRQYSLRVQDGLPLFEESAYHAGAVRSRRVVSSSQAKGLCQTQLNQAVFVQRRTSLCATMRFDAKQSRRKTGFTLIELLVVIAVIGILSSILLPSISKARDSARSAVCASNQRQINLALNFYLNAYKQAWPTTIGVSKLPTLRLPTANQLTRKDLVSQLKPWLKNQDVWFDPVVQADGIPAHLATLGGANPRTNVTDPETGQAILDYRDQKTALDIWSYRAVGTTYLFNQFTVHLPEIVGYPGTIYQGKNIETVYDSSKAIVLWDDPCFAGPALGGLYKVPHGDGINVSYLDGHTAWVSLPPLGTEAEPKSNFWIETGVLEDGWVKTRNTYDTETCGG